MEWKEDTVKGSAVKKSWKIRKRGREKRRKKIQYDVPDRGFRDIDNADQLRFCRSLREGEKKCDSESCGTRL